MTALELGVCRTGPPPTLKIGGSGGNEHLLIAGTTGAGKGSFVRGVLAAAAIRPDIQVAMIDRKAIESAQWGRRLSSRATDKVRIGDQSAQIEELAEKRTEIAAARGWEEWQPSVTEPVVIWLIDELAQAFKVGPAFIDPLDTVLHMGRALGISVVAATQQANAKVLGSTELRSLFGVRCALFDNEGAGYTFTYGKDTVTQFWHVFGWLRKDRPGLGVWTDGTGEPRLVRGYHWRLPHCRQIADATAHLTRRLPDVMEWTDNAYAKEAMPCR